MDAFWSASLPFWYAPLLPVGGFADFKAFNQVLTTDLLLHDWWDGTQFFPVQLWNAHRIVEKQHAPLPHLDLSHLEGTQGILSVGHPSNVAPPYRLMLVLQSLRGF